MSGCELVERGWMAAEQLESHKEFLEDLHVGTGIEDSG